MREQPSEELRPLPPVVGAGGSIHIHIGISSHPDGLGTVVSKVSKHSAKSYSSLEYLILPDPDRVAEISPLKPHVALHELGHRVELPLGSKQLL